MDVLRHCGGGWPSVEYEEGLRRAGTEADRHPHISPHPTHLVDQMSSMAGPSHVRFAEPMALPPRDRPRRSDAKYPRVAQRKGEGDRNIPDCRWRFKSLSAVTRPALGETVEVQARNPSDECYDAVKDLLARACEVVAKVPTSKRTSSTRTPKRPKLRLQYDPTKSVDTYTVPQLVFDSADSSTTNSSANTPCSEDVPPGYPTITNSTYQP